MAKFIVDTTNKLFIAQPGITNINVQVDLYSDAKEHWLVDDLANGFDFPFRPVGGDDIDSGLGTKVPLYAFLKDGWRIRPQEADHTLNIGGGILLVDGGGDPFVDTVGSYTVRINYQQPVQAITVSTGAVSPGDLAQAVLDAGVEGTLNLAETLRILLAVLAGKTSGFPTTATFRDTTDSKNRVEATLDANGNRTTVTLDPSP